MREGPDISRLAALIGDPARANMLTALMDGQALTASELADVAGITLPTASGHLTKLTEADLLHRRKQGRHRYFQLADGDVAATLEALMGLASGRGIKRVRTGPKDAAMREARVCYNHLAGRMGVHLFQSLIAKEHLTEHGDDVTLTPQGQNFMRAFGIDIDDLERARAPLCRSCLDWSERRTHLAGGLGRALLARMEDLGWLRRDPGSRAIRVTQAGKAAFDTTFPV